MITPASVLHMSDLPSSPVARLAHRELARPNPVSFDLLVQPDPHVCSPRHGARHLPGITDRSREVWVTLLTPLLDEGRELNEEVDERELGRGVGGVCRGGWR